MENGPSFLFPFLEHAIKCGNKLLVALQKTCFQGSCLFKGKETMEKKKFKHNLQVGKIT